MKYYVVEVHENEQNKTRTKLYKTPEAAIKALKLRISVYMNKYDLSQDDIEHDPKWTWAQINGDTTVVAEVVEYTVV